MHVAGKGQQRLDQAGDEGHRHDKGDDSHEAAHDSRHEHQGQEGGDCGQDGREHGCCHLGNTIDYGLYPALAQSPMSRAVLHQHDGVVDDNADHEDQPEQRISVEGGTSQPHEDEGGQECEGNAHGSDQGVTQPKDNPQHHDDQGHSQQRVVLEVAEEIADLDGCVARDRYVGRAS